MTATWGGAQWVLATLMIIATVVPIAVRAAGLSRRSNTDFVAWYTSEFATRIALVAILWWGGFWS